MDRKQFIKLGSLLPFSLSGMKLKELNKITEQFSPTEKMPALFLGHGSPMNAIEENEFTNGWKAIAKTIPVPNAILCISAHWETAGTYVTAMQSPETIHDFRGFPKALFEVQYRASGSPELAKQTKNLITKTEIGLDDKWGLDHGAWSVLKHLYPNADIPVIQLSLDYRQTPLYHYELAKELNILRQRGVLVVGSGNMVHNLGLVAWDKLNQVDFAYDWAREASSKMLQFIRAEEFSKLINFRNQGKSFDLAIPTPEHFLPLLYILALKDRNENMTIFNDSAIGGSLTMTSLKIA